MTITDDDVRSALGHALATADLDLEPPPMPAPTILSLRLETSPRPPRASRRLALAVVAAVVLTGGLALATSVGDDTSDVSTTQPMPVGVPGTWTEIDNLPIPSGSGFESVWTGEELVVFGGYEALCPSGSDCFSRGRSFTEAAALDPATGQWRQLADVPIPFFSAGPVAVDGIVYAWAMEDKRTEDEIEPGPSKGPGRNLGPSGNAVFLSYDPNDDRWSELPHPFDGGQGYHLVAAGDHVILNPSSDDGGSQPVRRYDPATQTWEVLPDDPLPRLFDRQMVVISDELFLFGEHVVPAGSPSDEPTLGARLDLDSMRWEELPDTGLLGDTSVRVVGDTVVSSDPAPNGRGEDPGPARIFDPTSGTWSDLPDAPYDSAAPEIDRPRIQGYLTNDAASYPWLGGLLLDLRDDEFFTVAAPPSSTYDTGRTVASAGTTAVAFGGADWSADGTPPQPRTDVWIWRPPT